MNAGRKVSEVADERKEEGFARRPTAPKVLLSANLPRIVSSIARSQSVSLSVDWEFGTLSKYMYKENFGMLEHVGREEIFN